jgi:hypothetical protein
MPPDSGIDPTLSNSSLLFPTYNASSPMSANGEIGTRDPFLRSGQHLTLFSSRRPSQASDNGHYRASTDHNYQNSDSLRPHTSRPRVPLDSVNNITPIDRFYNHDSPWSPHNPRIPNGAIARPYISQPSMSYEIREGPESEIGSVSHRSDSGYRSYYPHSAISNDPEHVEDLPEMTQLVDKLNVHSASSESMDMLHVGSTDQTSQYSGRSTNQGKAEFMCEQCHEKSKCKSDHKYVTVRLKTYSS